jgi:FMN-dependent oxidoreductase (nitrilotriacetate monooxygenase family)
MTKKFHLAQYTMLPVTHHSTATWKHPRTMKGGWEFDRPEVWQHVAQVCENAKLDFFFSADTEGVYSDYQNSWQPAVRYAAQVPCFDTGTIMCWLAAATRQIGIVQTVSTAAIPPYLVARRLATFDHLSRGRAGINIVTAFHKSATRNLSLADSYHLQHDNRYDRADEFMEVCYRLWDSWDTDAVVQNSEGDMFADPSKVHAIDFHGEYFQVAGPLNIHRSPQGRPLIVQAGQSKRGTEFAALHAEAVFSIQRDRQGMKSYYDRLKTEISRVGRNPEHCKVFFGVQVFVGETTEIAREKAALHNAMVSPEAGLTMLSGHLGHDLAIEDLDAVAAHLKVQGLQGLIDAYRDSGSEGDITLRQMARTHGISVSVPQVAGSATEVADWMADTIDAVGGDGFLLSPAYVPGSITEFCELVVPELQKRGRVRRGYCDGTLRDNLLAF